jgi:predicted metalloprotease with PDZ domain
LHLRLSLLWVVKLSIDNYKKTGSSCYQPERNKDDKVMVTVNAPSITTDEITYHIPKTVPGTYSEDNYGRYIEDLKAYDAKGTLLTVKIDINSWSISKAKTLEKITYLVNDSFDTEKVQNLATKIFSHLQDQT